METMFQSPTSILLPCDGENNGFKFRAREADSRLVGERDRREQRKQLAQTGGNSSVPLRCIKLGAPLYEFPLVISKCSLICWWSCLKKKNKRFHGCLTADIAKADAGMAEMKKHKENTGLIFCV